MTDTPTPTARERIAHHAATLKHQAWVFLFCLYFCARLMKRAALHDWSKHGAEEAPYFASVTPRLRGSTYGTEDYRRRLEELGPGVRAHYRANSHHPEHYDVGVWRMDLLDLVEMVAADWPAAARRHADGDPVRSIVHNRGRFKMAPQLAQILRNSHPVIHPVPHKLVIFDADGTLRRCTVEGQPCPNRSDEWEHAPRVLDVLHTFYSPEALARMRVASNQRGVKWGYLTEADALGLLGDLVISTFGTTREERDAGNGWMLRVAAATGKEGEPEDFAKPGPGMILHHCELAGVEPKDALYVGDMVTDAEAAAAAGCDFVFAQDFFSLGALRRSIAHFGRG